MTKLGHICIKEYLRKVLGEVRGKIETDGKYRFYSADYLWQELPDEYVIISRKDNTGNSVKLKSKIELDEGLISFFGLYSGDGAKGTDDSNVVNKLRVANISLSQREPNLVKFAVRRFKQLFSDQIRFSFCLGEDSAFFMDGDGQSLLKKYYGNTIPPYPPLSKIKPKLLTADIKYLKEKRNGSLSNEDCLAFYYFHKKAMEEILTEFKKNDISSAGLSLGPNDEVSASLRRPFKKGARLAGGSSRSDEMHIGGISKFGEFFLKIIHSIEETILNDTKESQDGLIQWVDIPSKIGEQIDIKDFFTNNNYGIINNKRPTIQQCGILLEGQWHMSNKIKLYPKLIIDPLFCYVSGLYLAEGGTNKSKLFSMFNESPHGLSLGFTSSESDSLKLMLATLQKIFPKDICLETWKVKVGSQYFPELVVIGLKNAVPMLRGGDSGDGKLRTMEISLSIKNWALELAPVLNQYSDRYSHVEPTGAGLARIDFAASPSIARWFFPLIMYATFKNEMNDPRGGYK